MRSQKSSDRSIAHRMLNVFENPHSLDVKQVTAETPTPSALLSLYAAVVDELIDTGLIPDEHKDKISNWGELQVLHESQHAAAVTHIGGTILAYQLILLRPSADITPGVAMAVAWRATPSTTPLEKATVAAHPSEISPGDLSDLIHLGFTGPESVGRAALSYNREHPETSALLLPLSFTDK